MNRSFSPGQWTKGFGTFLITLGVIAWFIHFDPFAIGTFRWSLSCEDLQRDIALVSQQLGKEPKEISEALNDTYFVQPISNHSLKWEERGRSYYISGSGYPTATTKTATIYWTNSAPTGATVIECLGAPPFYRAYVRPDIAAHTTFEFWYPEQGLILSRSGFTGSDIAFTRVDPTFSQFPTPDMQFIQAEITTPGTPQAIEQALFDKPYEVEGWHEPERRILFSDLLKPWVSWEMITFDGKPQLFGTE
jgi:hypothetical protein